ncbi:MAG: aminotransferase class V-fold PLP-dependent enzyme [Acidobacteriota bacterium]
MSTIGPGEIPPLPRRGLDPSPEEMRRWGYRLVDLLVDDLSSLGEQRVARAHAPNDFSQLDEPMPLSEQPFDECLDFLEAHVMPGLTRVHHPRFHAYLPCSGTYVGALGNFLASGLNSFVGSWLGGGSMAHLELVVVRWLAEAIGYPTEGSGLLTSGGSMANLIGLGAGREFLGGDPQRIIVYLSAQAHASCAKAAQTLGVPAQNLRTIDCDDSFRLRTDLLEQAILEDQVDGSTRAIVCANAGTTNTGAIDPLHAIADLCESHGAWLHVDGAYGAFAAAHPELRPLFQGLERADSVALDPHKWLYSPMGTGCIVFRRPGDAERAFAATGDYLRDTQKAGVVNFFDRGIELSRPARAVGVWLLIRSCGMERLRQEILEDVRLARLAEELLASVPQFEIVEPAQLSVVAFRFTGHRSSEKAQELMDATLREGEIMVSTTELRGETVVRFVVMNHRTTEEQVRRSVEVLARTAAEIQAQHATNSLERHSPETLTHGS